MTRNRLHRISLLAVVLPPVLAGCGKTPKAQFYLLSAAPAGAETLSRTLPADTVIGLQYVQVPEHLNRPQLVSRISPNRLGLSEFHRWAEPLHVNVTEVIAANLRVMLGTDDVVVSPRLGGLAVTYGVQIQILRLDGAPGSTATLEARWAVFAKNDEASRLTMRQARFTDDAVGGSHDALVQAESAMLAKLSREVAQDITLAQRPG